MSTKPPGRPLLLLLILFIGYTALSLARRSLQDVYTMIPAFMGDKHAASQLGVILSSQTIGYTVTKLVGGIVMDRCNPVIVLVCTLWTTSGGLFLMAASSDWYSWLVLYSLNGLLLGTGWPAVAKILRLSVSQKELATWWGVLSAAINLAGGIGPWLALYLVTLTQDELGPDAWKSLFIFVGLLCFTSGALVAWNQHRIFTAWLRPLLPWFSAINGIAPSLAMTDAADPDGYPKTRVDENGSATSKQLTESDRKDRIGDCVDKTTHSQPHGGLIQQIRRLVESLSPSHRLLLCCSATMHLSCTFLRFALSNWLPVWLHQFAHIYNRATINTTITCFELGGVVGNLVAGPLSDRNVGKTSSVASSRTPQIIGQMFVASALLISLGWTIPIGLPLWTLSSAAVLLGIMIFGSISLCGVLAVELAPPSLSGTCHAFSAFCANNRKDRIGDCVDKTTHSQPHGGLIQQIRRLVESLSPSHRLLLCCSATMHLSCTFLRFALSNWLPVWLHQFAHIYNRATINTTITCFELGGVVGNLVAGPLSDRNVGKTSSVASSRTPQIIGQMFVASALLISLGWTIPIGLPLWTLSSAAVLLGIMIFGSISLCGVLAVELAPPSLSGTCHAFSAFCANIGALLACFPLAWLAEQLTWSDAFTLSGVFAGLSCLPLGYAGYTSSRASRTSAS